MSCLTLNIVRVVTPAEAAISVMPGASLGVTPGGSASLSVKTAPQASLSVEAAPQASLAVTPAAGAELTVAPVCSVGGGTVVVLAGSDGPFRTRDGGYFLLNPETSPATRSRSRRR